MTRTVTTIRERIDGERAAAIVARVAPGHTVEASRRVYYPYRWYRFRCTAIWWLGRRSIEASCLVDARRGEAATSDRFERTRRTIAARELIDARVDDEQALATARTYVDHATTHGLRTLARRELELLEADSLHKPFWIVRAERPGAPPLEVLVDAVNGRFQLLGGSA